MNQEARFSRMEPELRKANLIAATLVCLKRHGFQGASIRKISAEAGVSVGLISHHYAGKDELVADAYMAHHRAGHDPAARRQWSRRRRMPAKRLSAFFRGVVFRRALLDPATDRSLAGVLGRGENRRRDQPVRTIIPMASTATIMGEVP